MFEGCTGITSVDLSNLVVLNRGMPSAFKGCTSLSRIDLSSLSGIISSSALSSTFQGCTSLTSISFPSLVVIKEGSACYMAFQGCTNLATINTPKLCKISGQQSCQYMCYNCTSLTELSFPNLLYTATNFNSSFPNMLSGCSNVTVHFPAEWQTDMSTWSNVTNGFGGTNTTVLFDLPNKTVLDLSCVKETRDGLLNSFATNNYFPNITSVDLSGLVSINSGAQSTFSGCKIGSAFKLFSSIEIYDSLNCLSTKHIMGCWYLSDQFNVFQIKLYQFS